MKLLLYNLTTGQSGTIKKNKNPQLEVKGFTVGTRITVNSRIGDNFVININNHVYQLTAAQAKQISIC